MCPRGQLPWILSLCKQPGPILPRRREFLTLSEGRDIAAVPDTPPAAAPCPRAGRPRQAGRCGPFRGSGGHQAAFRVRSQGLAPCTAWSGLGELPKHIFRFSSPLGSNPVRQLPASAKVRGGGREGNSELCQKAEAGTHMFHGHREGTGHGKGRDRSSPQAWGQTQGEWGARWEAA